MVGNRVRAARALRHMSQGELGEALGMMDFATASKIAGARFTILRGKLARLERALGQFMIDLHTTEHGYEEHIVPLLVNDATMFGTNQLPKFAEDSFRTTDGRWLIATSEISLTNMAAGEIIAEKALPMRVTALTECPEGTIVRTISRLDETCREVRNAARILGDPLLFRTAETASQCIKRDVIFAQSLWL